MWRRFSDMRADGRLPHAMLLHGVPGVGKSDFANRLCATLLCSHETTSARPCGSCRSCSLFAAGTHPDHTEVVPPADAKAIGVDQIRALITAVGLTAQLSAVKTVFISPADRMTHGAANTLLKTLEEPPGSSVFVLVTAVPANLPVTVRSRTQRFAFKLPETETALRWLQAQGLEDAERTLAHAGGAPLRALEMSTAGELEQHAQVLSSLVALLCRSEPPLTVAGVWKSLENRYLTEWLVHAAEELIKWRSAARELPQSWGVDEQTRQLLAQRLDLVKLFRVLDESIAVRRALGTPSGMNEQLWLERLAVSWSEAGSVQAKR